MEKENKNLKLYPNYSQLSRDLLFFYTINVLFLTQVKKIDLSAVVFVDTCFSLFIVLLQMPAFYLVGKIGIKKGMVLGNICNAIYLIIVINSRNILWLISAELVSGLAFSIKNIVEPAMLNGSINAKKEEKSKIFAKVQGKAVSGYYALSAISMILSGFLYEINGYIPLILSLGIVIITLIMSTKFEEVQVEVNNNKNDDTVSLKEAIKFVFKAKRIRCLLIFSAILTSIIRVLNTYEVSLLEGLKVSSKYIGIIFACLNIISAIASKNQQTFQDKFKNRTLTVLGLSLAISCIISGAVSNLSISIGIIIAIILFMYVIKYSVVGLYNVLREKYLSNFTNSKIDTKIFAIYNFTRSLLNVIFGVFASILIDKVNISEAMVIFGIFSLLIISTTLIYMKNKVGLDSKQYSEIELKYDEKN